MKAKTQKRPKAKKSTDRLRAAIRPVLPAAPISADAASVAPDLMDEKRAAKYIAMSVAYLRAGRCTGVTGGTTPHPPYLKLGRAIRYQRADLDTWLAARRVTPTPRPAEHSNASAAT